MPYITAWKIRFRCIEGNWSFSQEPTEEGIRPINFQSMPFKFEDLRICYGQSNTEFKKILGYKIRSGIELLSCLY